MRDAEGPAEPIDPEQMRALLAPLAGQSSLGVAVSGGADSMACLRLVHRWVNQDRHRAALTCLTVDHRLRQQSTGDARQVAKWCDQIGVACQILTWQGPHPKTNIQKAARLARYDLMTTWCRANGVGTLIVAHHLEDQAETMLMRLARGSAIGGLGAMAPSTKWDGVTIFRPLLAVPRARLAASLAAFGQSWSQDPSNTNHDFERVRLRAALPGLAEIGLTPAALGRSAQRARRAAHALDQISEKIQTQAGENGLDFSTFSKAPEEIQLRLLAGLIARAGGAALAHGRQLERAVAAMQSREFPAFTLGGCRIGIENSTIIVAREGARRGSGSKP
ncbi:MAG: tRNA lysidine(34) synthetase TilS [Alphaproteobacteria bacterium]